MKKLVTLFVAFIACSALWASNVITYTATSKLPETTENFGTGLHVNEFNVTITDHSFSNGQGTITFANELTNIGDFAFDSCATLTSVTIPNSVTGIGAYAFEQCKSLTSLEIPQSVINIGEGFCALCNSLTNIQVDSKNKKYQSVDGVLFDYNMDTLVMYPVGSKRTKYSVPEGVKVLASESFLGSIELISVELPNSVDSIGAAVFSSCTSLSTVTLGEGLRKIADGAFYDCSSITSMTCEAINPPVCDNICFYMVDKSIPLYVPAGSISAYQEADGWKDFTNIQALPTGIDQLFDSPTLQFTKIIRDGQLYILRDGKIYNAQGAFVK